MRLARIPAAIGWVVIAAIGIALTIALLPVLAIVELFDGDPS